MTFINVALILQIFALLNPLASFPVLISASKKRLNVRKIAISAVIIAFIVALALVFLGPPLFNLLGISLDSFRIAGGIVILLLGLETINSKDEKKEASKTDSLISLMATPLLTGPATISFLTLKVYEIGSLSLTINLLIACIFIALVFVLFSIFVKRINPRVISIASKVFGLFLAAIAIEMIAKGLMAFLGH
jgi:multiple antibiotic resistance protein